MLYRNGVWQPYGFTFWRDQMNAGSSLGTGSAAPARTQLGSSNVYFAGYGVGDGFSTEVQFNHDAVQGSVTISPHLHIMLLDAPSAGDKVKFSFDYTFASINSAFSSSPTNDPKEVTVTGLAAYTHLLIEFVDITVTMSLSGILLGGVKRIASGQEYGFDVAVVGWDVHYQVDTPGSRQEYIK